MNPRTNLAADSHAVTPPHFVEVGFLALRGTSAASSGATSSPISPLSAAREEESMGKSGPGARTCVRSHSRALHAVRLCLALLLIAFAASHSQAASSGESFRTATEAYRAGNYAAAAEAFAQAAEAHPASGTLQNLGVAEWQSKHPGLAVLAWERALWLDPFNKPVHENLRFARKTAQLESPDLAWYEVVSTWLPSGWWAWIAGASFWLGIAMATLPGTFHTRRRTWHQAFAALAIMVFLLSLPGYAGIHSRSRIGFILEKDTPLRLTPTSEAQAVTRLGAGDPARLIRHRGDYLLIRTPRSLGWVQRAQFGLTCPTAPASESPRPPSHERPERHDFVRAVQQPQTAS